MSLADYRIEERIAVGGMAEIFRAVRTGPGEFQKSVAIKRVLPDLNRDPEFVQMFLQEARLGARLCSPRLVQVFDFGEDTGVHYLVMEYVEGTDLAGLFAERAPLPIPLALHLGRELCAALGDLHEARDEQGQPLRIVHRDVNPGNVLLSTAGDLKLGDFGIAKGRARSLRTERGTIKGKLAYLSPEQIRGDQLDARTDLYAAGLILFEALTGRRYLLGDSEAALLQAAAQPLFRPPSTLRAELPAWLDEVVARALAPEPARRFPDARRFREALGGPGPLGDPSELRLELAALVSRPTTAPLAVKGELSPGTSAPALASSPPAARHRTERLQSAAPGRRGKQTLALVLIAALVAVGAVWMLLTARRQAGGVSLPTPATTAPVATFDRGWQAPRPQPTSVRLATDARALRRRSVVATIRLSRADARLSPPARPAADLAAAPRPRAAELQVRADLAELAHILHDKEILADDVPSLAAEHSSLQSSAAQGTVDPVAARRLLLAARRLTVDRAFVDTKLARITARLRQARLDAASAEELNQRARRALSYAVTGRYTEANRELNVIHRRLESH